MKTAHVLAVFAILAGCMNPGAGPKADETHFISSNPAVADCNKRPTVESRETCYVDVADARMDQRICEDVGSLRLANLCYDRLGKKLADPSLCLKIRDDEWRYTACMSGSSK